MGSCVRHLTDSIERMRHSKLAIARRVLDHVDAKGFGALAYARVDIARGADGRALLMELEIVEPSLFLDRAPDRASMLVDATLRAMMANP